VCIPVAAIQIIAFAEIKPWHSIAAVFPINKVLRFYNGNSGKNKHGSRNHIICIVNKHYIRVREIGWYYGVGVGAVPVVTKKLLGINSSYNRQ